MKFKIILVFLFLMTLIACEPGAESPRGFSLPQGNAAAGKITFEKFNCIACHDIDGIERGESKLELAKAIKLGGVSAKVTTYGELVTSIIHPSHKISRAYKLNTTNLDGTSKMPSHNDTMTVTELINLIAYLQPLYKVQPITFTHYGQFMEPQ